jgi:hypothetical protein
VLIFK